MFTGTFDSRNIKPEDYPEGLPPIPALRADADPMVEYIPRGLSLEIGEREARMLLRIGWQIRISGHYRLGNWWTYQSVNDLHDFFPTWGRSTVARTIKKLVRVKLILATNQFNKRRNDKTLWYAFNLEEISKLQSVSLAFFNPKNMKVEKVISHGGIGISHGGTDESHSGITLPEDTTEVNSPEDIKPLTRNAKNAFEFRMPFSDIREDLKPFHNRLTELSNGRLRIPSNASELARWSHGLNELKDACAEFGPDLLDVVFEHSDLQDMELTDPNSFVQFALSQAGIERTGGRGKVR